MMRKAPQWLSILFLRAVGPSEQARTRSGRQREDMRMQIYVSNLAWAITEDDLRQLFEAYGTVASVRIITDRDTGRSRGFGFVEMPDAAEAQAAIAGLNGTSFGERTLTVNAAREREERGGPRRQRDARRPRW